MTKLSPQKELILSYLRKGEWVCGREWLNHIKDDRKRISELNEGYMAEKGFTIVGEPCRGQICGVTDCPLFKRKAMKVSGIPAALEAAQIGSEKWANEQFESLG